MDQEQQLQSDLNDDSIELQYQEVIAQKCEDKNLNEVKNETQHKKKKVQFRYKEVQQENLKDLKDHFGKFFQMSMEEIKSSFEEMSLLLFNIKRIVQLFQWNQQIRHKWGRNNPSFLFLLVILQINIAVCYSLLIKQSLSEYLTCIYKLLAQFLVYGLLFTILPRLIVTRFLMKSEVENHISYIYSLDVFLNAYFVFLVFNYICLLILTPFWKESNSFLIVMVSSSLNLFANYRFYYIFFKFYSILPDVKKIESFLIPIGLQVAINIIMVISNHNYYLFMINYFL
ncbi:hypothetical protein ABPG72_000369 [Tetrahymena utriculariae]